MDNNTQQLNNANQERQQSPLQKKINPLYAYGIINVGCLIAFDAFALGCGGKCDLGVAFFGVVFGGLILLFALAQIILLYSKPIKYGFLYGSIIIVVNLLATVGFSATTYIISSIVYGLKSVF